MTLNDIKNIKIEDFDYRLPDERIAKYPLPDRDSCKLLMFAGGETSHHTFRDIPDLLPPGSLLVMNNTRVINARMEFHRASGARIEIFLLEPLEPRDYAVAFQTRNRCTWQCLVGNLKKWKDDYLEKTVNIAGREVILRAKRLHSLPGNSHAIEFQWSLSSPNNPITQQPNNQGITFASIVEAAGNIPIPPYLNRKSEESDTSDYQTVYSRIEGSVAAPTAGLHFTPELLDEIRHKGIETREVTLHVGAGTFQPVKSDEIGDHPMHREIFEIDHSLVKTLREALESGRNIIAVGTTTVRTLESLPLIGIGIMKGNDSMTVGQWEAYCEDALSIDTVTALKALESYMELEGVRHLSASTSIMIAPGFRWRIVDGMVTNFHQPQSTLLLLVSSLLDGDNLTDPYWRHIYSEALDHNYRFLSYGDACLFLPHSPIPDNSENDDNPKTMTTINLPGSKSIAARALVCRLLSGHDTTLPNLPDCGDTRGMLRITEAVRMAKSSGDATSVDIGEGGTTLRFGMAACASIPGLDITLRGSIRLMERPHGVLIDALRSIGAGISISSGDSIRIHGVRLRGGLIDLDGSVSSQYVSALMLAAPMWEEATLIRLHGHIVSLPYISMTAAVMRSFGAHLTLGSHTSALDSPFSIRIEAIPYAECASFPIEGDWSAASYFFQTRLMLHALGMEVPEIEFPTLKSPSESLQGDSLAAPIFADALRRLKANDRSVMILNLKDSPDLVPAVAVGLCIAGIQFRIEGVAHLRHKETDRMAAIATELGRLGFAIETGEDIMAWSGEKCEGEPSPIIRTYGDHRMAMAFAPAKLAFPSLSIQNPEVVEKSFPGYWTEIVKLNNEIKP